MGFLTGKVLGIYVLLSPILEVQENIQSALVYYLWREGKGILPSSLGNLCSYQTGRKCLLILVRLWELREENRVIKGSFGS